MKTTIETAVPADIPELCKLLAALFSQEAEFHPDAAAQARGLEAIIGKPEVGLVLAARVDGQLAGMVNLLFTVSTALGERVALLEDMVVAPGHRGAGLGQELLGEAIAQAWARGCRRITLLTDEVNADAQRFYKRQGFSVSPMRAMRLML